MHAWLGASGIWLLEGAEHPPFPLFLWGTNQMRDSFAAFRTKAPLPWAPRRGLVPARTAVFALGPACPGCLQSDMGHWGVMSPVPMQSGRWGTVAGRQAAAPAVGLTSCVKWVVLFP